MPDPVHQPVEVGDPGPGSLPGPASVAPGSLGAAEQAALDAAREGLNVEARSQFRMALDRFLHHRVALAGLGVFVFLTLLAYIGPVFWHYKVDQITPQFLTGPSLQHPFGTTPDGFDMFARVLSGTATTISTALLVALMSTVLGTLIGAIAGYYGKWADAVLMRVTDLFLVVPLLAILLVLGNIFKRQASNGLLIAIVLAAVLWTVLARLVRGTFLSLREREFVEAEWAIGASDSRIILRHMIPNAIGPIVVNATLTVAVAMLIEALLSFLGLGIQLPEVSLGNLINLYQDDAATMWWLFYFPAFFLIAAILSVNFIGDGLRDALDPTQRVRT